MKRALLSWSGGKDCAWSLERLRGTDVQVAALLTTFDERTDRVAMHAVRRSLVEDQANAIGIPLWAESLPWPCPNDRYEKIMSAVCRRAVAQDIQAVIFGDLFLEDIRSYRERMLAGSGLEPLFPLSGIPTAALAREMLGSGLKAIVICVDVKALDATFVGRQYDARLLSELPISVDPCGENGEFHSFVYDGPMFRRPVAVQTGSVSEEGGFAFADLRCPVSAH